MLKKYILLLIVLIGSIGFWYLNTPVEDVDIPQEEIPVCDSVFDHVKERFKLFNDKIDSATINKFIEVSTEFKFIDDPDFFELCIAQICLESGAKQRYSNGKLVVSSGNAIGLGQIVPTTAFLYIKKVIPKNDTMLFKLGGSEYAHIKKYPVCWGKSRRLVKEWLADPVNNLIMWGYIMSDVSSKNKYRPSKTLMIYNQGQGYVNKYLRAGNSVSDFIYVRQVRGLVRRFDRQF